MNCTAIISVSTKSFETKKKTYGTEVMTYPIKAPEWRDVHVREEFNLLRQKRIISRYIKHQNQNDL